MTPYATYYYLFTDLTKNYTLLFDEFAFLKESELIEKYYPHFLTMITNLFSIFDPAAPNFISAN
jgi:hypothetical protein